jgi:hypothetical protein
LPASAATAGGRGVTMPIFEAIVVMPEMLDPNKGPRTRINAVHFRAVRKSAEICLRSHKTRRLGRHFHVQGQKRYRYKRRKPTTIEIKKRRAAQGRLPASGQIPTDLVKTGKTKRKMKAAPLKLRHRRGGGYDVIHVELMLPMKDGFVDDNRPGQQVTFQDVKDEIARFSIDEEREIGYQFRRNYINEVSNGMKPRAKKQFDAKTGGRLRAFGIRI